MLTYKDLPNSRQKNELVGVEETPQFGSENERRMFTCLTVPSNQPMSNTEITTLVAPYQITARPRPKYTPPSDEYSCRTPVARRRRTRSAVAKHRPVAKLRPAALRVVEESPLDSPVTVDLSSRLVGVGPVALPPQSDEHNCLLDADIHALFDAGSSNNDLVPCTAARDSLASSMSLNALLRPIFARSYCAPPPPPTQFGGGNAAFPSSNAPLQQISFIPKLGFATPQPRSVAFPPRKENRTHNHARSFSCIPFVDLTYDNQVSATTNKRRQPESVIPAKRHLSNDEALAIQALTDLCS